MAQRAPLFNNAGVAQEMSAANGDTISPALVGAVQNNLGATADPTASNDTTQGYSVGSAWFNTASGITWRCRASTAGAAAWEPGAIQDHPGLVSGQWYQYRGATNGTSAMVANTLTAVPIFIPKRTTLQALGIYVTSGVSSTTVILGIYSNLNSAPAALLGQTGAISTTSGTNFAASGALTADVTLEPGIYWLAALFSGAPTVMVVTVGDGLMNYLVGGTSVVNVVRYNSAGYIQTASQSYASGLPATFGAGAAAAYNNTPGFPLIAIEVA